MKKLLPLILCFLCFGLVSAQTTYDFSTPAVLIPGPPGFSMYNMQANITIGGVAYKITSGANGSLTNQASGGSANSKCLRKDGSGGDQFNLSRADGQPFQFYGLWLKHQSMNSYSEFMSLPPFYSIYYSTENEDNDEYYEDTTPMQGGSFTTASATVTKNITVTSVQISFRAMMYYWIDDIIVGPAAGAPVAPSITSQPSNKAICANSNTAFSVTASDATSYQWQLNAGSGFANISNGSPYSGATTSTLSITGASPTMSTYQYRCIATGTSSITSNNATLTVSNIIANTNQTNVSCNGGSNASATITLPTGGTAPYTYNWTPGNPSGDGTRAATGLIAGTWTVTVSDANSCTLVKQFTITEPSAITATTAQTNVSCFGGSNGSATVNVSGGVAPYSYNWSPSGGNAATASGLSAGSYTCTITDENGCSIAKSFTITQPASAPPAFTLQPQNNTADASGNATFTITAVNASGLQWQANTGAGFVNISNGGVYSGATTATLTITGATAGMNGYSYRCVAGSLCSAPLSSNSVTLTTKSNNAFLSDISVSAGSLSPEFSEENLMYNMEVSPNTGSLIISPETSDKHATVTVNGHITEDGAVLVLLGAGANTITVVTTAEDGETTREYTIKVMRPSASVVSLERAGAQYTNSAAVTYTLKFNGEVNGLSADNLGFSAMTTLSGYFVQSITHTAPDTYSITVNTGEGDGTLSLNLINAEGLTAPIAELPVSSADGFIIDKTLPVAKAKNIFVTLGANGQATALAADANDGSTDNISSAGLLTYTISKATFTSDDLGLNTVSFIVTDEAGNSAEMQAKVTVQKNITSIASLIPVGVVYGEQLVLPETVEVSYSDLSKQSVAVNWNVETYTGKAGEYALTGTLAGAKFTTNSEALNANITVQVSKRPVHVQLTGEVKKTYDGSTAATVDQSNYQSDKLGVDQISFASIASYDDKNAGSEKNVSLVEMAISGTDADNYTLANATANANIGTILPRELQVSLAGIVEKTYDGKKTATLTGKNFESDKIENDNISFTAWAEYDNKHAGEDKTVTASDFFVDGKDAINYNLTTEIAQTTGTILKRNISAAANQLPLITKVYDGSVDATLAQENYSIENTIDGDEISVNGSASYENRNAGNGKVITINELQLSGAAKDDYALATTTLSSAGDITGKVLEASFRKDALVSKIYDGNTQATIGKGSFYVNGVVGEDDVALINPTVGVYDNQHAGENKNVTVAGLEISGDDASNYILHSVAADGLVGKIVPKEVTLTADAKTKVYGTSDPGLTFHATGLVNNEQLSGSLSRASGKNVGSYGIGQGSVTGGNDYLISEFIPSNLTITPASLVIKAEDKKKKQGAGNPVFTATYAGLAAGDSPADLSAMPVIMSMATERSPIGYYDIVVSGGASSNYNISYATGELSILPSTDNAAGSLKAWSSTPGTIQVRVYAETEQDAIITLYTEIGQPIVIHQKHLSSGINTFTLPTGHLASSTYVLSVWAKKFKLGQRVPVNR